MSIGDIPNHLKDAHYSGACKMGRGVEYKYPHSYPNHYVTQQYLPNNYENIELIMNMEIISLKKLQKIIGIKLKSKIII